MNPPEEKNCENEEREELQLLGYFVSLEPVSEIIHGQTFGYNSSNQFVWPVKVYPEWRLTFSLVGLTSTDRDSLIRIGGPLYLATLRLRIAAATKDDVIVNIAKERLNL